MYQIISGRVSTLDAPMRGLSTGTESSHSSKACSLELAEEVDRCTLSLLEEAADERCLDERARFRLRVVDEEGVEAPFRVVRVKSLASVRLVGAREVGLAACLAAPDGRIAVAGPVNGADLH